MSHARLPGAITDESDRARMGQAIERLTLIRPPVAPRRKRRTIRRLAIEDPCASGLDRMSERMRRWFRQPPARVYGEVPMAGRPGRGSRKSGFSNSKMLRLRIFYWQAGHGASVDSESTSPKESAMSSANPERNRRTLLLVLTLAGAIPLGSRLPAADDPDGARTVAKTIAPGQALPKSEWVDVLGAVDLDWDTVSGDWRRDGADVTTGPIPYSRIMLPVQLEGSYDLKAEFTRLQRDHRSATILFPVGRRTCLAASCAWSIHGLERIDGMITGDRLNPATRRPGLLINGQRYSVTHCGPPGRRQGQDRRDARRSTVDLLERTARVLGRANYWGLPVSFRPALAAHESVVIYHAAEVRAVSGTARMTLRPKPPAVDFKQRGGATCSTAWTWSGTRSGADGARWKTNSSWPPSPRTSVSCG